MKTTLYKRNILYRVRRINNRNILFGENQCFELNELALEIWNKLNGKVDIFDIVNQIVEQYDEERERVMNDVKSFIDEMVSKNVLLESE
ncbi:PqqD family protein [Clostridium thermarum]|uniref:PqqD family protein n=1 Tax=Clostridium thermarum TaxID=1716543 RepID=UPI0013D3F289|nr:PqqD family protein [Clostridium thermarum]